MNWRRMLDEHLRPPLTDAECLRLEKEGWVEDLEIAGGIGQVLRDALSEVLRWRYEARPRRLPRRRDLGEALKMSAPIVRRARALSQLYVRMAAEEPFVQLAREEIGSQPSLAELGSWLDERRCECFRVSGLDEADAAANAAMSRGVPVVTLLDPIRKQDLSVPRSSVLGTVATSSERLSRQYPWSLNAATKWLVCGRPVPATVNVKVGFTPDPEFNPFGWELVTDTRTRVVLTIDPAITPAEVAKLYAAARATIAPPRVRPMRAKSLALAQFVFEQPEDEPRGTVWDGWLAQWNLGPGREHGRYDATGHARWNFRRDCLQASRRLRLAGWRFESERWD